MVAGRIGGVRIVALDGGLLLLSAEVWESDVYIRIFEEGAFCVPLLDSRGSELWQAKIKRLPHLVRRDLEVARGSGDPPY